MKVHAVIRSYPYEGDELLLICSTDSLAERRAKQAGQVYPGAHVRVTEYEVDGPAPWELATRRQSTEGGSDA